MKKQNSSKDKLNLFLSAFLILAYIVCGYFFVNFAETQSDLVKVILTSLTFVVFGAILFYATRVGDGKPVVRFSPITLIMVDIPALYVVLATNITQLPLHSFFVGNAIIFYLSAVALGYGIPYTFLSGFELVVPEVKEEIFVEEAEAFIPVEGGIEQEIQDTDQENESEEVAEETDEIIVEGVVSEETENTEEVDETQEIEE